jgi:hypothetical protein
MSGDPPAAYAVTPALATSIAVAATTKVRSRRLVPAIRSVSSMMPLGVSRRQDSCRRFARGLPTARAWGGERLEPSAQRVVSGLETGRIG